MQPAAPVTSTYGLLARLREGDETAFTLLFEKYRPRLAVLIRYKLGAVMRGQLEVDDLLQEVFLRASREIARFEYRSPGSFLRWLARLADHVVIDAVRHQTRQKRQPEKLERFRTKSNPGGAEPLDSETPSRLLAQQERVQQLLDLLEELPEDYRRVILLARFECLSTAEIAERLGKSRENVAVLLHRALQRFRELKEKASSHG